MMKFETVKANEPDVCLNEQLIECVRKLGMDCYEITMTSGTKYIVREDEFLKRILS